MKAVSTIIAGILLAGCSGMDTSGGGMSGSSGSSVNDMNRSGFTSSTDFRRGVDLNDPYHGG